MPNNPHVPKKATRDAVALHAAIGTPQETIGRILGIDGKTLRKHYRDELDLGSSRAIGDIAGQLYKKAMSGDTASMIFWLKTRAGWRETTHHELTSPDGSMTPQRIIIEAAQGNNSSGSDTT
jgi:hypothetical protein